MAIVRVSPELLSELLFKGLDVEIRDVRMNRTSRVMELSIVGKDVPDCAEAIVICHSHREPGDDPHVRIEIQAAAPLPQSLSEASIG